MEIGYAHSFRNRLQWCHFKVVSSKGLFVSISATQWAIQVIQWFKSVYLLWPLLGDFAGYKNTSVVGSWGFVQNTPFSYTYIHILHTLWMSLLWMKSGSATFVIVMWPASTRLDYVALLPFTAPLPWPHAMDLSQYRYWILCRWKLDCEVMLLSRHA